MGFLRSARGAAKANYFVSQDKQQLKLLLSRNNATLSK